PGNRDIFACEHESVTRRTPWRSGLGRRTTLRRYAPGPRREQNLYDHWLSKVLHTAFDVLVFRRQHVAVHRLLSGFLALSVVVFVMASPAVGGAKAKGP